MIHMKPCILTSKKTKIMTNRKKLNDQFLALLLFVVGGVSIVIYATTAF